MFFRKRKGKRKRKRKDYPTSNETPPHLDVVALEADAHDEAADAAKACEGKRGRELSEERGDEEENRERELEG